MHINFCSLLRQKKKPGQMYLYSTFHNTFQNAALQKIMMLMLKIY